MSYYLQFDGDGPDQVASNAGYGDFGRWVEGLNHADFPQVVHLYEHGWSQELDELESQLKESAKSHPPKDGSLKDTLAGLIDLIEARPVKAQTVVVTDGMMQAKAVPNANAALESPKPCRNTAKGGKTPQKALSGPAKGTRRVKR